MNPLKIAKVQFGILLFGTGFAWVNFSVELISWISETENKLSCTKSTTNPFLTPCFYGAIFFTIAFYLSFRILKSLKKN